MSIILWIGRRVWRWLCLEVQMCAVWCAAARLCAHSVTERRALKARMDTHTHTHTHTHTQDGVRPSCTHPPIRMMRHRHYHENPQTMQLLDLFWFLRHNWSSRDEKPKHAAGPNVASLLFTFFMFCLQSHLRSRAHLCPAQTYLM